MVQNDDANVHGEVDCPKDQNKTLVENDQLGKTLEFEIGWGLIEG